MAWPEHPRLQPLRARSRLADVVLETLDGYSRHRTGRNASLLAYMGILTVFPLLLTATTVLGIVLKDNSKLQQDIVDSALAQIPVVGDELRQGGEIGGSWWVFAVGLAVSIWGSLRAFVALQTGLDDVWEVTHGRDNYIVQRVRALFGIGVIGFAQVGSVVLAALVGHAGLPRIGQVLITLGGLALNVAVVGAMYIWLTSRDGLTWRIVWPGTVFTAVLFTVLQFVGTNLMANKLSDAQEVYGTFGALIALASWISLHGLVALLGAELNAARVRLRQRDTAPVADQYTGA